MTCQICAQFETTGVFVRRSNFFRKDSLYSHEKSASHVKNVVRFDAKKDPSKSVAAATLRKLNVVSTSQEISLALHKCLREWL